MVVKKSDLNFVFECEQCDEVWEENILDLIDRIENKEQKIYVFKYLKDQLEKIEKST